MFVASEPPVLEPVGVTTPGAATAVTEGTRTREERFSALNRHASVGQFIVTATNAFDGGVGLPSNS